MDRHEIKCINRTNYLNPHERIENIGGLNYNGTRWKINQATAIKGIEEGKWQFFININGQIIDTVVTTYNGNKYLKTPLDLLHPEKLLALPECP